MKLRWSRIFITLFVLVLMGCSEQRDTKHLSLIPYPQSVQLQKPDFIFPDTIKVKLSEPENVQNRFLFTLFQNELDEKLPAVKCIQSNDDPHIKFILIDHSENNHKKWPIEKIGNEGYILRVGPELIQIAANSSAGLFYGTQTLMQLVRGNLIDRSVPGCEIVDWPDFEYRGWQDDVSRGPIPTMAYLKREIQTLASYKMNCMTLYTEDIFKLEKHPTIAPAEGITAEQIRELEAYAENYHVEIMGNFQSFGHMGKILRNPRYTHLGERRSELSPAKPETYDFLRDVYSEIAPAYQSKLFHINCDEVRPFDSPEGIVMMDSIGLGGAFVYHINQIEKLLQPYEKKLLFWGDMPYQYPEITSTLPKDLIAVIWVYHPVEDYMPYLKTFQESNMDFMISPGVSSWVRIWPDIDRAVKNIAGFSRFGMKYGSIGSLITTWDDTGDNLFNYNWYPLLWGAECSWNAVKKRNNYREKFKIFNYAFDPIFFNAEPLSVTPYLWQFDSLRNNTIADGFATKVFWSPPSVNKLLVQRDEDQTALIELLEKTEKLRQSLINSKKRARTNRDVIDATLFTVEKIKWLGLKEKFENEILNALKTPQTNDWWYTRESLLNQLDTLKESFTGLWALENRAWWLNRIHEKYDQLASSINAADKNVYVLYDGDDVFSDSLQIELANPHSSAEIYYTINGQNPTKHAHRYTQPFTLTRTTNLRATADIDGHEGTILQHQFTQVDQNIGLDYYYYRGIWNELPNFDKLTPIKTGRVLTFHHQPKIRQDNFAFLYKGYIHIVNPGKYCFALKSDDGSRLTIDHKLVVDNDGLHRTIQQKGEIELSEGYHEIQVSFFGRGGYENLFVYFSGPEIQWQEIPASVLFRMK